MLFLWTEYECTVEVFTLPKCKPDPPENCWEPETNSGIQWPLRGASPCPEHTDPTRGPKRHGQCAWPCSVSCWEPSEVSLQASHTCAGVLQEQGAEPGAAAHTLCPLRGWAPLRPSGSKPQRQWHQCSALGSHRWCLAKHVKLRP